MNGCIDKESGEFLELDKVHPVNHQGKFFNVQGTLDAPTSPQGRIAKYGRKPDDLEIMSGVFITVAKTEEEAIAKQRKHLRENLGLKRPANTLFGKKVKQII